MFLFHFNFEQQKFKLVIQTLFAFGLEQIAEYRLLIDYCDTEIKPDNLIIYLTEFLISFFNNLILHFILIFSINV